MSLPVAALALALLLGSGRPGALRWRALTAPAAVGADVPLRWRWLAVGGVATAALAGAAVGSVPVGAACGAATIGLGLLLRRSSARPGPRDDDPADLATAWTQLAVCLEVGLPVGVAVAAAADALDGRTGGELRRVAGLLELGADPGQAWAAAGRTAALSSFARAAGRSASTGAGLARAARAESARLQASLVDAAEARAQRAAVLITAPLGLCFLPAFLVLGIAPVVVGLAVGALRWW